MIEIGVRINGIPLSLQIVCFDVPAGRLLETLPMNGIRYLVPADVMACMRVYARSKHMPVVHRTCSVAWVDAVLSWARDMLWTWVRGP